MSTLCSGSALVGLAQKLALGWGGSPGQPWTWWKDPPCDESSWVSTVDALLEPLGSRGPTGWDVGCGASLCLHVVRVDSPAGGAADRVLVSRKADQAFSHFKEGRPCVTLAPDGSRTTRGQLCLRVTLLGAAVTTYSREIGIVNMLSPP